MAAFVHIYAPGYVIQRQIHKCSTCGCRRVCAVLYYVIHDPLAYCTSCGEDPYSWPRRFKKITSERREKIRSAKKLLAEAIAEKDFRAAMQRIIETEWGCPDSQSTASTG